MNAEIVERKVLEDEAVEKLMIAHLEKISLVEWCERQRWVKVAEKALEKAETDMFT
jgi:hypothetical protein